MRLTPAFCGFAALAFAQGAAAVTLAPISFSPEFEAELTEDFGVREGEYLRADVEDAVRSALARRGVQTSGGNGTIEIVIVDADPNRPTMQQLGDRPGLDPVRSVSVGGAELRAVLRDANGQVLTEVEHERYNHSLQDLIAPPTTWGEARRAIRQFANKVADAYIAHSGR